jgi:methylamine dehydrogenase heavy chain
MGVVRTLPVPYPPHWVLVHDGAFFHMSDGKVMVLDADAGTAPAQFKGMINNAFMGSFVVAPARRELLVAETFHSRGQRGERTDVLTIYDPATLAPSGEVVLPGGKRYSGMPERHALQLIDGERLALVFNLTPATSVSVVDLEQRALLSEVPTPGCSLIYPTGRRGFTSLCGDGAMLSVQLEQDGTVAKETRTRTVWDVDKDPLFEKPVIRDGIAYFPTFHGQLLPVDLRGDAAKPGKAWSLLDDADRKGGWRPGGWQFLDRDREGRLYMLFHPEGADGTHKNPGVEVWVYDLNKRKRERRITLQNPAVSIAITRDEAPLMIVSSLVSHEMVSHGSFSLDVYDVASGRYLRSMTNVGYETPFVVHTVD